MTWLTPSLREELRDAGRLGYNRFEGFDSSGPGCSGGGMLDNGKPVLPGDVCREPIAYVKEGLSYPIMLCVEHGRAYERQGVRGGTFMCSVCGTPQKAGWTLDGSGRCQECGT
jgi:hypothetical protein